MERNPRSTWTSIRGAVRAISRPDPSESDVQYRGYQPPRSGKIPPAVEPPPPGPTFPASSQGQYAANVTSQYQQGTTWPSQNGYSNPSQHTHQHQQPGYGQPLGANQGYNQYGSTSSHLPRPTYGHQSQNFEANPSSYYPNSSSGGHYIGHSQSYGPDSQPQSQRYPQFDQSSWPSADPAARPASVPLQYCSHGVVRHHPCQHCPGGVSLGSYR